ncbi:adenosylcobinamide-GDP ribazoletransferase [Streptacidiphilus sp. ASG 303]|uniref:adenosylcobinamide-GDP ribazoletransferase n=1 Tax=Streptacidiphilus sp. ASG 303 TaxID=2896847 RepID=UPI001E4B9D2E|nr:adenosylcobinamide-GDP ribazoletransferase [Streptacidiphilus sp. ASG 303]MCD0481721.1 adenosylcobinamide-GDP ribazoletransferase [Streptacidiphilus sp. ASG 303]
MTERHTAGRAGGLPPLHGLRFAFGTLTVLRVRVDRWDRPTAGAAMLWAPLAGLVVGAAGAACGAAVVLLGGGPLLAAVAAVGTGAALTRGLHLDGLADVADGLGSGRPAEDALRIMKQSDIGPFGVLVLVLVLLGQAAALAGAYGGGARRGALAAVTAAVAARCALAWGCLRPVPAARPGGLGAAVAGTVAPGAAAAVTAGWAVLAGAAAAADGWAALCPPAALAAGVGCAGLLLRRCVRRLGGVTGDVLGAMAETAATGTLVALALLPAAG